MWTSFLKGSFIVGILLLAAQSFAATKLSIEGLRKEVLNNNLNIKVQYEKYYQSQKNVSVAFGQFLPNANLNLVNVNASLAILQSIVPTPTNWFIYQASKELQIAEKYTTESIKLNILEGLTISFINIKHQEELLESLKKQELFLATVFNDLVEQEQLGFATINDVFLAKRNLLQHRQDIFALNALMIAEKQSLMMAINMPPDDEIILGDLPNENSEIIPRTANEGIELALKNSTELKSNSFQAEAARFMVSSRKWSFISFNGIGFDYSSTLAIERSQARVIDLQAEQIELKIRNQVFSSYDELDVLDQRIKLQELVLSSTKEMDQRNTELYENDLIPFSKYLDSKKILASEERLLIKLKMERSVKIAHVKRILGYDASSDEVELQLNDIQLVKKQYRLRRGITGVSLEISSHELLLAEIFSVTYSVVDVFDEKRIIDSLNHFSYSFRLKQKGHYKVVAKIKLVSGEIIERTDVIINE